jgi:hypothetical protein
MNPSTAIVLLAPSVIATPAAVGELLQAATLLLAAAASKPSKTSNCWKKRIMTGSFRASLASMSHAKQRCSELDHTFSAVLPYAARTCYEHR